MTILTASDFSDNSRVALVRAAAMARQRDEPLLVLHAIEQADLTYTWQYFGETPWDDTDQLRKRAEARLREFFRESVPTDVVPAEVYYRVALRRADDAILEAVEEQDVSVVVLGATGGGAVRNFILGSTADRVARLSPAPVLVVTPDDPGPKLGAIVAPVDMSEASAESLQAAIALARQNDAKLFIRHALPFHPGGVAPYDLEIPPHYEDSYEGRTLEAFNSFIADFDLTGLDVDYAVQVGAPADVIIKTVEDHDADLVVLGTHGRTGFKRLLLGSIASKVLREMPCSVLTFRTPGSTSGSGD